MNLTYYKMQFTIKKQKEKNNCAIKNSMKWKSQRKKETGEWGKFQRKITT